MKSVSRMELFLFFFLGAVLFGGALCLVELHCRTRLLFVAHEHELDIARRLQDDQAELLMKVRRAALPGSIAENAAELGLAGAAGGNTYTLIEKPDGTMAFSQESSRRLAEAEAAEREKAEKKEAELAAQKEAREAKAKKSAGKGKAP